MASTFIITQQNFSFRSAIRLPIQSYPNINPNILSYSSSVLKPATFNALKLKQNHLTRATSEEVPTELDEESKFAPLDGEHLQYGPPAMLLLGFEASEATEIKKFLTEIDGDFMEVILCSQDMVDLSLWEAMNSKQSNYEAVKIAKELPRICFMSGLTGEEMMMFIDAFPESGLELPVFAALVPNSADKPIGEVIEEIMADDEMMTGLEEGEQEEEDNS